MGAFNTARTFGWVSRLLHWLISVATIGLFVLALWYRTLDYGHPWYVSAPALHVSIGFVLVGFLVFRIAWSLTGPFPEHVGNSALENRLATLMHWALRLSLAALVVTGYLYATADGRPASIFGVVEVPALPMAKSLKGTVGWVHEYLSWTVIALASLHGLAALKHHFVDRDDTLRRMVSGRRTSPRDQRESRT